MANQLQRLTVRQTWLAVLLAIAVVALLDFSFPGVGFAPLYIPTIGLAGWLLGKRAGYIIAIAAAILATVLMPGLVVSGDFSILISKFVIRLFAFAFITSIILSFRRSYDRERYLARRDRMTGALNQESFREQVPATLAAARNSGRTVLVALLDFDNFKLVNSEHGHAAGDTVLRLFANGTRSILRHEDEFGRLGGDEFAVVAALLSDEEAATFAETLHGRLTNVLRESGLPVTFSMGALIVPPANREPAPVLLHRADMLMYAQKRAGKNGLHIGRCEPAASEVVVPQLPPRWLPA